MELKKNLSLSVMCNNFDATATDTLTHRTSLCIQCYAEDDRVPNQCDAFWCCGQPLCATAQCWRKPCGAWDGKPVGNTYDYGIDRTKPAPPAVYQVNNLVPIKLILS